jgi:hypothetical protein
MFRQYSAAMPQGLKLQTNKETCVYLNYLYDRKDCLVTTLDI